MLVLVTQLSFCDQGAWTRLEALPVKRSLRSSKKRRSAEYHAPCNGTYKNNTHTDSKSKWKNTQHRSHQSRLHQSTFLLSAGLILIFNTPTTELLITIYLSLLTSLNFIPSTTST